MSIHLQTLRPTGNPIQLQKSPLESKDFADYSTFFYQSGTAALAAALISAKSICGNGKDKPEVLLPAYTCPDLISACIYADIVPVLVDFEPGQCWMSLEQIKDSINERTIAIIAVRFLGIPERMSELRKICERHNLILLEDSAQGFPTTSPETYWQGDMTIISFGRGKPVNMLEGGAILTRLPEICSNLPTPNHAPKKTLESVKYLLKAFLYNFVIHPIAYRLVTQLPGLQIGDTIYKPLHEIDGMSTVISTRIHANIRFYNKLPNVSLELHNRLKSLNIPSLLNLPYACHHDFNNPLLRYPILILEPELRDTIYHALRNEGASLMYQMPLYKIQGIPAGVIKSATEMCNAEKFSQQLLTLPTHTGVTNKILDRIFNVMKMQLK